MVAYWSTLSLNIPDFTRFAKTQKAQVLGQAIGLNTTMPLYSFIGVAVTSATVIIFGETIWDPVVLLTRISHQGSFTRQRKCLRKAKLQAKISEAYSAVC
jgi:cytosine/uracil/thiamine/allantoin permease